MTIKRRKQMKITTKIVLIAILFAFSLQSAAIAEWKFKPPGEIAKNLSKLAVKKAQENPETTMEIAKKVTGEDDKKSEDSEEETKDNESEDNKE